MIIDKFANKIICGDCLEVMKEIPDNSVDLVLTDPPYNISQKDRIIDRNRLANVIGVQQELIK